MEIRIPNEALYIVNTLESNGFEAFVVGGCVRDSLLGSEPKDWDICTPATPAQTMKLFSESRVIETGLKHGSVSLILNDTPFEVTTYRTDGAYSDGRHPDNVEFIRDIKEDLARRDFTINAMAYSPDKGLMDFFNGIEDLKGGIIKCVGDPDMRFREDALRLLRALRFASVLGFSIEENTERAIYDKSDLLKNIAAERIEGELLGLLNGNAFEAVIINYQKIIAEALSIMYRKGFIQLKEKNIKRWLEKAGEERFRILIEAGEADEATNEILSRIEAIAEKEKPPSLKDLAINGSDLIEAGIPEGPEVGRILKQLRYIIIDEKIDNDRAVLLEIGLKLFSEYPSSKKLHNSNGFG